MTNQPKFRNRLLMPWTWSRWTWAMLMPVLMGIYFFSAIPFFRLGRVIVERQPRFQGAYSFVLHNLFLPVWYCANQSPTANSVLGWQFRQMRDVLGDGPDGGVFGTETICGPTEIKFPPASSR